MRFWRSPGTERARSLVPALVAAGVGALILMLGLDTIERALIYFPARQVTSTPADAGLAYEDVFFTTVDGVTLHGWFVPGTGPVTWVWFHDNAGNVGHRVPDIRLFHQRLGANIFIFDYRGYGRSGGAPSEEGIYRDAEAALEVLRRREDLDADRFIYFGRSLGAAVAIELATRFPPRGLVIEGVFSSIAAMARRHYPFLPVWPLLRTRYDSLTSIARVDIPVFVIHAEKDEVVPLQMGREVFEAAREPKRFFLVVGAHHNDTSLVGGESYISAIAQFTEELFTQG